MKDLECNSDRRLLLKALATGPFLSSDVQTSSPDIQNIIHRNKVGYGCIKNPRGTSLRSFARAEIGAMRFLYLYSQRKTEITQNNEEKYDAPFIFSIGDTSKNDLFYTYDDGYFPNVALAIADAADAGGGKVTFLPVGNVVNNDKSPWIDIAQRGHGFAIHTMSHPYLTQISYAKKEYEILKAQEVLESVVGEKVTIMRPPFGQYDRDVMNICATNGIKIMTGTVDSLGYTQGAYNNTESARQVAVNSSLKGERNGGIIVAHIITPDGNAAPELFQRSVNDGFNLASIPAKIR